MYTWATTAASEILKDSLDALLVSSADAVNHASHVAVVNALSWPRREVVECDGGLLENAVQKSCNGKSLGMS